MREKRAIFRRKVRFSCATNAEFAFLFFFVDGRHSFRRKGACVCVSEREREGDGEREKATKGASRNRRRTLSEVRLEFWVFLFANFGED